MRVLLKLRSKLLLTKERVKARELELKGTAHREIAAPRHMVAVRTGEEIQEQAQYLDEISAEFDAMSGRAAELRVMLLDLQADLATLQENSSNAGAAIPAPEADVVWRHLTNYQKLIRQIRGVVSTTLPLAATVIVVSKGDDELLKLDGRRAWHFPQTEDGTYIGYYPANSTEAIAHLEVLRVKGGDFLLLPDTAFWWLDYYREFHQHLDACYQRIWSDEYCIIYQLSAL